MQVILKETVEKLGKAGEVIHVRDGFARNFLLPFGKAVMADPKNLKELEHHKKVVTAKEVKRKTEAESLAKRIQDLSITLIREAGEGDKLFGAVTNKDIAEELRRHEVVIDRKHIHLVEPIKALGDFEIAIRVHPEVTANLKVTVSKS